MALPKGDLILKADILAAFEAAIAILAATSQEHAEEIGGFIHEAFQPNEQLVPMGVLMMFFQGSQKMPGLFEKAVFMDISNTANNLVLEQLRKLPGVDEVYTQFEESQQAH